MNARNSTLVLGLGKTGYSVIRHLHARGGGGRITAADSRENAPCLAEVRAEFPKVDIIAGELPLQRLGEFGRVIASPGIALDASQLAQVSGDIALFAECARAPIIAITGSNGKSTVTTMLGEMLRGGGLRAPTGGNLGTPALDLLASPGADFYVLELSSFQLQHTRNLNARAAAVLNISADHLDRHADIGEYTRAKARILQGANCARVLNRDDAACAELLRAHPHAITFGGGDLGGIADDKNHFGIAGGHFMHGAKKIAPVADMKLQGAHHAANALAAFALAHAAGVELSPAVVHAALNFRGLEHRFELVTEIGGVKWINDSKATNVGATLAALSALGVKVVWIAGGSGKGADFSPLAAALQARARLAVLFGRDAARIADAVGDAVHVVQAGDLQGAVRVAAREARRGEIALFSPACASTDMFADYAERGRAFKQMVGKLAEARV